MEIKVGMKGSQKFSCLRNRGLDHVNEIAVNMIMCSTNAHTVIIRKQV